MAEEINSSRVARRDPKQIYKETLREDRQRQAMHQETEEIEKKMAKVEYELRMLHAEGEVLDQASLQLGQKLAPFEQLVEGMTGSGKKKKLPAREDSALTKKQEAEKARKRREEAEKEKERKRKEQEAKE